MYFKKVSSFVIFIYKMLNKNKVVLTFRNFDKVIALLKKREVLKIGNA